MIIRNLGKMDLKDRTSLRFRIRYSSNNQAFPQILIRNPVYFGCRLSIVEMQVHQWESLKDALDFSLWKCKRNITHEKSMETRAYYQYGSDYYDLVQIWYSLLKYLGVLGKWVNKDELQEGTTGVIADEVVYIRVTPELGLISQFMVEEVVEQASLQRYPYERGFWITNGVASSEARQVAEFYGFEIMDRFDNVTYQSLIENKTSYEEIQLSPKVNLVVRSIESLNDNYKSILDIREYSRTQQFYGWRNGFSVIYEEIQPLSDLIGIMLEVAKDRSMIPVDRTEIEEPGILYEIFDDFGL